MGLQPRRGRSIPPPSPASEAIHLGGDPSVKGPLHAAICCRLACLPPEDGGNPVRPPAGRDDGRRLGRELQLDVGQRRQRRRRRHARATARHQRRVPDHQQHQARRDQVAARSRWTNIGSVDGLMAVAGEVAADSTAARRTPFAERLNLTITNGDRRRAVRRPAVGPRGGRTVRRRASSPTATPTPTRSTWSSSTAARPTARTTSTSPRASRRLRLGARQQLGLSRGGRRTPCPGPTPAGSPPWRPAGSGVSSCWRACSRSARRSCRASGYQRYVLVGRSMEPTIHKGSLVFDEVVPVRALRKGDVITYVPPVTKKPVTHRIISVSRGPRGERVFRTKGDNNRDPDLRPFTLEDRRRPASPSRSRTSDGCSSCSRCRRRGSS